MLIFDAADTAGDGGNPELAGGEGDFGVSFVFKDNLGGGRRLGPSPLYGSPILEDIGGAGADSFDDLMIIIIG